MTEAVQTPFSNIRIISIGMVTGNSGNNTIVISKYILSCSVPCTNRIVIESNGEASTDCMCNGLQRSKVGHQSTTNVGISLRSVDGNALVIAGSCNFHILESYRDGCSCIGPTRSSRHRKNHYSCTVTCSKAV